MSNKQNSPESWLSPAASWQAWQEYWLDACQRSILSLDVLRQRGNTYVARSEEVAPHVLSFTVEVMVDGRDLPRPVNYVLTRIVPPADVVVDARKRPFIVFDPRAGHGPGIGGMKHDSEIGVALRAGHPCYFVGFLPEPVPGQTIADVCAAEAHFIETVIGRHPDADKPALIGNCQAGWQIMMMAALHPELPGPILLAGSPLSYWAGERGKAPMRYLGGLLGGTWLTALAGDLGKGIFDGANLVANFESMHPANTWWKKAYDVYSRVDTEATRFLDFEKWWGSPVLLNAGEMQAIADDLFVGNKLTSGELKTPTGVRVDLREIRSPIIVFCSWGDDITPPPQALQWILDLYDSEEELVEGGQTIIYCLHQTIGHLGIFVSGKVATREHGEFAECMDFIDVTPPGLYEAVITGVDDDTANQDLVTGKYIFQLQKRRLADLREICKPDAEDERCFEAAAHISRVNTALYRATLAPAIQALASEPGAALSREMHPHRLRFKTFSDANPAMQPIAALADTVRADRHPVAVDNPFIGFEKAMSASIVQSLEAYTKWRDSCQEMAFFAIYGSPFVQALAGIEKTRENSSGRRMARELSRDAHKAQLVADLAAKLDQGGQIEGALRAVLYIQRADGQVDERALAALKRIAAERGNDAINLAKLKVILREQSQILLYHEAAALETLPKLLPRDAKQRAAIFDLIQRILTARGALSADGQRRLHEIESRFALARASRSAA